MACAPQKELCERTAQVSVLARALDATHALLAPQTASTRVEVDSLLTSSPQPSGVPYGEAAALNAPAIPQLVHNAAFEASTGPGGTALLNSLREEVAALMERLEASEAELRASRGRLRTSEDETSNALAAAVAAKQEVVAVRARWRASQDEETALRQQLLESEATVIQLREESQKLQVRGELRGKSHFGMELRSCLPAYICDIVCCLCACSHKRVIEYYSLVFRSVSLTAVSETEAGRDQFEGD